MISNQIYKLVNIYDRFHNGLSIKQKAFLDILVTLLIIPIPLVLIGVLAHFGYLVEFFMLMLLFSCFMAIKYLYRSRVDYYETLNRINK